MSLVIMSSTGKKILTLKYDDILIVSVITTSAPPDLDRIFLAPEISGGKISYFKANCSV